MLLQLLYWLKRERCIRRTLIYYYQHSLNTEPRRTSIRACLLQLSGCCSNIAVSVSTSLLVSLRQLLLRRINTLQQSVTRRRNFYGIIHFPVLSSAGLYRASEQLQVSSPPGVQQLQHPLRRIASVRYLARRAYLQQPLLVRLQIRLFQRSIATTSPRQQATIVPIPAKQMQSQFLPRERNRSQVRIDLATRWSRHLRLHRKPSLYR